MSNDWRKITVQDVEKAIQLFDNDTDRYPKSKNTFLIFNSKKYPAKHIRAIAYRVAFGLEISKSKFTGGAETTRFFENLGFTMEYQGNVSITKPLPQRDTQKQSVIKQENKKKIQLQKKKRFSGMSGKNVVEQKNALQLVLNRYFDSAIVSEKTFHWMVTPENAEDYSFLVTALRQYRGKTGFHKGNYKLRCDFACESQKIIFEYDERQHFSLARKAALDSYPDSLQLHFDKQLWINKCDQIRAQDNQPPNRDETRAYYDSIRDILSAKNGYRLIRIMHEQFDWENPNAYKYIEELVNVNLKCKSPKSKTPKSKTPVPGLKIGLYLQGEKDYYNGRVVNTRINDVSKEKIDILVFPENSTAPHNHIFYTLRFESQHSVDNAIEAAIKISYKAGCAVIIGAETPDNKIYNLYANSFASGDETKHRFYIKHTMTDNSPLGDASYRDKFIEFFKPIILKNTKIGMTICYDCNHAAFSRVWGKLDVDIIINTTGGNVVYEKWHRYNKVRSLENNCFSFCTMRYFNESKINSYTFGFTPNGALMTGVPLYSVETDVDKINNIYIYDTSDCDWRYEPEYRLAQRKSLNSTGTWAICADAKTLKQQLLKAKCISENIFLLSEQDKSIIICVVNGQDIAIPETVLKLLYHPVLSKIKNKRYLIINHWDEHNDNVFNTVISDVLKVRSAENFCAVVYYSPSFNSCYQSAYTKNIQVIQEENGLFKLDLSRMTGPESVWKNKSGMRALWRNGYEVLIDFLNQEIK